MSKRIRLLRLTAVALVSFGLGFGARHLAQPRASVAARVNGDPILANELQSELNKRFGSDVLRDLVHQKLILQEAARQKIKVDPKVIDRRLGEMKAQPQVQAMLKSGQVEESDLRRNLSTLVPLDQLVATQLGADQEAEYLREHAGDLETITVQHILVKDKETADKLREEAATEDFAELARKHSLDERTKAQGGKLGQLHRSELEPDVAEALFQVPQGQVSEPFQGQDGFHLFKVVERRTSLEDLRPQIREMLVSARRGEYLEELRSSAKIETVAPYRLPLSATPAPEAGEPEH